MNCRLRRLALCALLVMAGLGTALGQEDDLLQRYALALENLEQSVALLPQDSAASRDELERAAATLRRLAQEATGASLVGAMERVFELARTAIANQSETDLAVQAAVLRGGFQRAVFDAALSPQTEPEAARARLLRLAADMSLDEEAVAALGNAAEAAALRRSFEAGVGRRAAEQLRSAAEVISEDRGAAYRALAGAYGDFLIVQDSPAVEGSLTQEFLAASQALVDGRTDELAAPLERVTAALEQLGTAAPPAPAPTEEPAAPTGASVADEPGAGDPAAAGPEAGAPAPEAGAVEVEQAPVPATPAEPAAPFPAELPSIDAGAAAAPAAPALSLEALTEQVLAAQREAELAQLQAELGRVGLRGAAGEQLATQLHAHGYLSLGGAVERLYGLAARALTTAGGGEQLQAQQLVGEFEATYLAGLAPLVARLAPELDRGTRDLARQLQTAPGLRAQDAATLIGQVSALQEVLAGRTAPVAQVAQVGAVTLWAGMPRIVTLVVLALLAFLPLYLLNLAFGSGNRNWQLIGIALFLLLLPMIFEGVAALADLVAGATGLALLERLAAYSVFQNAVSQLAWVALTGVAIALSAAGFYGICKQFGLLGGRRRRGDAAGTTAGVDAGTLIDWDEEF